jgi:hypothetical protein
MCPTQKTTNHVQAVKPQIQPMLLTGLLSLLLLSFSLLVASTIDDVRGHLALTPNSIIGTNPRTKG